jgi:O-methyltransferase
MPNVTYQPIYSWAQYCPWLDDKKFMEIYEAVKEHTLLDIYRCYELWDLVRQTRYLHGSLLEVGVWRGGSGMIMAKAVAKLETFEKKVLLCDTFTGLVDVSEKDGMLQNGQFSDTSTGIVLGLMNKVKLENIVILPGTFPNETGKIIENLEFCFCHIDVDTYQSAKNIFEWVWPRMVTDGIIVFDDYGFRECGGVTEFVNEIRYGIDRLFLYNLNGHAIIIKQL